MGETGGRNERRKAETRRRIIAAGHELFQAKGYAATSMEDISRTADVAIRTIYLHFESKAAVLLAYHDAWVSDFVRLVGERGADEPLDAAVHRAISALAGAGHDNDRRIQDVPVLPPYLEFLAAGSPEIAGHMFQRWVAAQDELTARFREVSQAPADSPTPRLEATAVFAAWLATMLDFRQRWADGVEGASSHDMGALAISAFVRGTARTP